MSFVSLVGTWNNTVSIETVISRSDIIAVTRYRKKKTAKKQRPSYAKEYAKQQHCLCDCPSRHALDAKDHGLGLFKCHTSFQMVPSVKRSSQRLAILSIIASNRTNRIESKQPNFDRVVQWKAMFVQLFSSGL